MDRQKGVNAHSTQSYRTETVEDGGIPAKKKTGSWLSRKLQSWKARATDILRTRGFLPDKPILRRKVVDHQSTQDADQKSSRVKQYLLEYPCQFALRCIDEERAIPPRFVKEALRPGLRSEWNKTANIPSDQANNMIDLLIQSLGFEGIDVNEQFLDSYEHNSRFAPLSPAQKFNLILKFNEQLKTPQAQQNFNKILATLNYYNAVLSNEALDAHNHQNAMENLAEYLIDNARTLPPLTSKGLAACSHFSKYINSMQYQVSDIPAEMARFIDYMVTNPEIFTSTTPSAMAADYIFGAEFEDEKAHLPDVITLTPFRPDSDD